MALPCDPCDLTATDAITPQIPQYNTVIAKEMTRASPWPSLLDGMEIANNQGAFVLNLAQGVAAPNVSLASPEFTPDTEMCNELGEAVETGTLAYSVQPETIRGTSQAFCVKGQRVTVQNALTTAIGSIRNSISMVYAADVQYQMLVRSGLKFTVNGNYSSVDQLFAGGIGLVNQYFPAIGLPNAAPTFQFLTQMDTFNRQYMDCRPFQPGNYAVVLTSKEMQDTLFFEEDIKDYILGKPVQGGFASAAKALETYEFIQTKAKGLMFGTLDTPPRFLTMPDADGADTPFPTLIEPWTKVAADRGYRLVPNPDWLSMTTSPYEIGFMVYPDSFMRGAPRPYLGEGAAKFPAQSYFGDLRWYLPPSVWQDFGYFGYQITRLYQPQYPQRIVPFAYKRCPNTLNLTVCEGVPSN